MLEAKGLTKRYPGVTALQDVCFSVSPGQVVGLIGENGAGKSTLIKILGGLVSRDSGDLTLEGATLQLRTAADATAAGIGIIHQELSDLDNLDIAGNVLLGREPRRLGFLLDRREMLRRTTAVLDRLGMRLDPRTPVSKLSIGQRQMVEIAKAISLEARYLIMDEPTSSLSTGETERLLSIIRDLRAQGVGVVYVSHRLQEVKAVADRVVALRDGKNAGELKGDQIEPERMVELMVGRQVTPSDRTLAQRPTPLLEVTGLRTGRFPAHELTFAVGAGEIVGMAGLVGAGRTEVARALFGVDHRLGGRVRLSGDALPEGRPQQSIAKGLYLVPEDRRGEGLIAAMTVRENVTLPGLCSQARAGWVDRRRELATAGKMREKLGIKAPSVEALASGLSGGNQQKVVLAKWLALNPRCLILDEPTRGIDVGARAEIYQLMRALAREGVAILMISSDMEEILAMSDRILVMSEGALTGELAWHDATEERVMALAVGHA